MINKHVILFFIIINLSNLRSFVKGNSNIEFNQPLFPIDFITKDAEFFNGPLSFGHKYITGGAGEGDQQLRPEDGFEHRENIKSDNVLPAYCEPPNPCPIGYTAADGCLEEFENTAEFSRNYQAQQQCLCDQEHMFNCPMKQRSEYDENIEELLEKNGLHKSMIAKKFHEVRINEPPRRKRLDQQKFQSNHYNPFLLGEPLKTITKKNGRNIM